MNALTLQSPAKLNLVLDVVSKRADGFHELRTLFERIDLADTITLTKRFDDKIKVICAHPHVPKGSKNLVVIIARKLQKDFGVKGGVTILILKRIPVAAGLAGGSSNGATVLMGLNQLWHLELSQKQMLHYAALLGSDVSFFIYNTPYALGTGRGEHIKVLPIQTKLWHVLVTPKVKMLTKAVFGATKKPLTYNRDNANILLPFLRVNDVIQIGRHLTNDLEAAILSLRPEFKILKEKLVHTGALGVNFSGSGPSVYALARSLEHAKQIRAGIDRRYAQVFIVATQF